MKNNLYSLEKYFFFDECGDPVNGYCGKNKTPIFFVGCIHTENIMSVDAVHSRICDLIDKESLHYDKLSKKARLTSWKILTESSLKLDVGISQTTNFEATKKVFTEVERKGDVFRLGAAEYSKFDEMCQTQMFAMMTWLIFAGESSVADSLLYEKPVRLLSSAKENPVIEFDKSSRVNIDVWKNIHLDRQLKKYGLSCTPVSTKSKGTELADILVSGYRDRYLRRLKSWKKFQNITESFFSTSGDSIKMLREN